MLLNQSILGAECQKRELLDLRVTLDFENYTSGLEHPFPVQDLLKVIKPFCESVSKSDMFLDPVI